MIIKALWYLLWVAAILYAIYYIKDIVKAKKEENLEKEKYIWRRYTNRNT